MQGNTYSFLQFWKQENWRNPTVQTQGRCRVCLSGHKWNTGHPINKSLVKNFLKDGILLCYNGYGFFDIPAQGSASGFCEQLMDNPFLLLSPPAHILSLLRGSAMIPTVQPRLSSSLDSSSISSQAQKLLA